MDLLWILLSTVLVLLMQAGFLCLESGFTRAKNAINVALKNLADLLISLIAWWAVGFGLMFGVSLGGWIGSGPFLPDFAGASPFTIGFFLFQVMFCATAATIVSGAVAERMRYSGYQLVTLGTAALIYPVFGHWAWGGLPDGADGWLRELGFVDFAGSTVVHGVGGWVALATVLLVGPRQGRFSGGRPRAMPVSNVPLATVGLLLFLVGWIGFNGGSTLAWTGAVPGIVLNTLLAAAGGGIAGHLAVQLRPSPYLDRVAAPINGILAGLVSITAGCHAVSPPEALLIGALGGLLMLAGAHLLGRYRIDDAINAIPVHLLGGIWGTLAAGLLGDPDRLGTGLGRAAQVGVQLLGVTLAGVWAFGLTYLLLGRLNRHRPLRVSPADEEAGLNVAEHGARTDLIDLMQAMRRQETSADPSLRLPVEPFTEVGQIARQHNRLMDALERAQARTEAIVRNIRDGIFTFTSGGILTSCNPGVEQIFGIPAARALGRPVDWLLAALHLDSDPRAGGPRRPGIGWLLEREKLELAGRHPGRGTIYLELSVTGNHRGAGDYTALVRDVSERRQVQEQLFREKEQAQITLESIADGVVTTDAAGRVLYLNAVAGQLTGWSRTRAIGLPLHRVLPIVDTPSQRPDDWLTETVLRQRAPIVETKSRLLYAQDGAVHVVQLSAAPIGDRGGGITGVVVVFHDVTQARMLERQLSYQATHDALTRLINRAEFERRLQALIVQAAETGQTHVLCYMDLDQFKLVNDVCGHSAGDLLLRQLADLLRQRLRMGDTLARLGGDEFGLLLQDCPPERGLEVADTLRGQVRGFRFHWEGRTFAVGVSIGLVPITATSGSLADTLRQADAACYAAKDGGRNQVHVYQPDDRELAARSGQMQWVNRIQRALDGNRFCLYYQDIVPVTAPDGGPRGGGGRHFEVLVRMLDDAGGEIAPGAFIPAAERYDLMREVDEWVVRNTLEWLGRQHSGGAIRRCAINLSGATVGREASLAMVQRYLEAFRVPPELVGFEITETAAVANLGSAIHFLRTLGKLGCTFSLDDFGSGLSSFRYLRELPVDYLKIDGIFIKDILHNRVDRAMVRSINDIGHVMGLETIAEFVESADVLERLHRIGVDYAQGYHLGRPRPLADWTGA
jgi:Amt family ammonium transporter